MRKTGQIRTTESYLILMFDSVSEEDVEYRCNEAAICPEHEAEDFLGRENDRIVSGDQGCI